MSIRIALTDDHNVVIKGICNMLADSKHIEVEDIYHNGAELLEGLKERQPQVLLLDLQMPDMNGDELTELITTSYPAVRILILTGVDTTYYVKNLIQHGAMGYLLKDAEAALLVEAIETVHRGEQFIDPALQKQLVQDMLSQKRPKAPQPIISRREKEILELILSEYTSQEIAEKLFLSLRTVENYRVSLLQKLKVKNTAGLVKVAIEMRLVE